MHASRGSGTLSLCMHVFLLLVHVECIHLTAGLVRAESTRGALRDACLLWWSASACLSIYPKKTCMKRSVVYAICVPAGRNLSVTAGGLSIEGRSLEGDVEARLLLGEGGFLFHRLRSALFLSSYTQMMSSVRVPELRCDSLCLSLAGTSFADRPPRVPACTHTSPSP